MTRQRKLAAAPRREVRAREVRVRRSIAAQLNELLLESGVTQAALASAASVEGGHLSRLLRGIDGVSFETLLSLGLALGADVSVRLFPTTTPRIRDHLQAAMLEALIRRLDPARWRARPEVPVPAARGVIDLVLQSASGEPAIACEAHSQLRSVDLVLRRLQEKTLALAALDGGSRPVSGLLLVRSTLATRHVVRLHTATFEAAPPGSSAVAIAALSGSAASWPGPTLLWARVEGGRAEILESPPRGIGSGR
jgi:transcriptional regulator with XRE-family HTH domain